MTPSIYNFGVGKFGKLGRLIFPYQYAQISALIYGVHHVLRDEKNSIRANTPKKELARTSIRIPDFADPGCGP